MTKQTYINNIPQEIRNSQNCVCWDYEDRNGKLTKVPINARTGGKAQSNNSGTWTDFYTALESCIKNRYAGIGFMFSDGYVGVDIDHCIDAGIISDKAKDILSTLDSYSEVSPSGTGLHIYLKAKLPPVGRRKNNVEMYDSGRFFTLSGKILPDYSRNIEDRTNEINIVHQKYISKPKIIQVAARPYTLCELDLNDIIEKACNASNGSKFQSLYNGNWKGHYSSQSEADQAFCNMLAFWFQCDYSKMDNIFRSSGLYRQKWDSKHGPNTYGQLTLQNAINGCSKVYQGKVTA